MEFNLTDHLETRYFRISLYSGASINDDTLTVILWNLSGSPVGYQSYSPLLPKRAKNPKEAKYFTYVTEGALAVFGLESLQLGDSFVFVCEGIFDAARLHSWGIPAIAVLGSNPLHLVSWLNTLPQTTISAVQGDQAGLMLSLLTDKAVFLPAGEDVSSLSSADFQKFFSPYTSAQNIGFNQYSCNIQSLIV